MLFYHGIQGSICDETRCVVDLNKLGLTLIVYHYVEPMLPQSLPEDFETNALLVQSLRLRGRIHLPIVLPALPVCFAD